MGGLPGRWGFVDAEYVLDDREGSEVGYVAAGITGLTIHLSSRGDRIWIINAALAITVSFDCYA